MITSLCRARLTTAPHPPIKKKTVASIPTTITHYHYHYHHAILATAAIHSSSSSSSYYYYFFYYRTRLEGKEQIGYSLLTNEVLFLDSFTVWM